MKDQRATEDYQSNSESAPGAPTLRAVVGSHRIEEEMFGRVFDPQIIRRIGFFVRPYRREFLISVVAVLVFTLTQLAIPMIIRHAIDNGVMAGPAGLGVLHRADGGYQRMGAPWRIAARMPCALAGAGPGAELSGAASGRPARPDRDLARMGAARSRGSSQRAGRAWFRSSAGLGAADAA